jgi:hypothetical protein
LGRTRLLDLFDATLDFRNLMLRAEKRLPAPKRSSFPFNSANSDPRTRMLTRPEYFGTRSTGIDRMRASPPIAGHDVEKYEGRRRETVLQVGPGTDFDQLPFRKLTPQEKAEALAKYEAAAASAHFRARSPRQIQQEDLPFPLTEALHYQFHPRGRHALDSRDPAREVKRAVPRFEGETRTAKSERKIVRGEREQLLAGFEDGWLPAVFEEALNHRAGLLGASPSTRGGDRIEAKL